MPAISVCRDCHGDNDRRKIATTCVMCHDFHNAGRGPFSEDRQGNIAAAGPNAARAAP
jgi:hypothetical protein